MKVSIVIPTFRRPALLAGAVRSCLVQEGIEAGSFEIVVVDNDPAGSAEESAAALAAEARQAGIALHYVHERRPGISHARNSGIAAAAGARIAFLDDDEVADRSWLERLSQCLDRSGADATLGPVRPVFERAELQGDPFWTWFFTRDRQLPAGAEIDGGGTGNCMFEKARCCPTAEPFAPEMGLTGGEDIRFFQGVRARGGRIVWCPDAVVHEIAPASRSRFGYALRRHVRLGQLFVRSFTWASPPRRAEVARWMAIGAAQVVVLGILGLLAWPFARSRAMLWLARAANGLGKVFWMPRLTLTGYGARRGT